MTQLNHMIKQQPIEQRLTIDVTYHLNLSRKMI